MKLVLNVKPWTADVLLDIIEDEINKTFNMLAGCILAGEEEYAGSNAEDLGSLGRLLLEITEQIDEYDPS